MGSMYCCKWWDQSRNSSRYYNPEVGRWINSDDLSKLSTRGIAFEHNTFAYCKNNSVCNKDDYGYFVSEIGILVHNLGCEDVATNTLKRISKSQIKQLGGEKVTAQIKKQFGRSLSNLYVDSTGNVYVSVNGSNIAQWVGDIATLAEMYR